MEPKNAEKVSIPFLTFDGINAVANIQGVENLTS